MLLERVGGAPVLRFKGDHTLVVGRSCTCVISELKPGYVLLTYRGDNDGEIGDACYAELDRIIERDGFVVTFMDSRLQASVAWHERERAIEWARRQRAAYREGHLLFRSRLLEMALAVGNLALRTNLRGYARVEDFERAITRYVPGFKKLPDLEHIFVRGRRSLWPPG